MESRGGPREGVPRPRESVLGVLGVPGAGRITIYCPCTDRITIYCPCTVHDPNWIMHCTRAIDCDSVCTRWAVPIALKIACHTVEMCLNCKIPSSYNKEHIKRNKRSSRRLMGDQVASIRRWGPREHAKPTPLFFTPTGSIWWAMEIRCRTPAIALGVVYANNDRGNNNKGNNNNYYYY